MLGMIVTMKDQDRTTLGNLQNKAANFMNEALITGGTVKPLVCEDNKSRELK